MFRCPSCGREAFPLTVKLGANFNYGSQPRCPFCGNLAYRYFVIGGSQPHSIIMATIMAGFAGSISFIAFLETRSKFGFLIVLLPLLVIALFVGFNYYFSYFEAPKKERTKTIMTSELKNTTKVWPYIRKGEIYELLSSKIEGRYAEEMYMIAKVETIKNSEIKFRIIRYPLKKGCEIKDDFVILCKDRLYPAFVKEHGVERQK